MSYFELLWPIPLLTVSTFLNLFFSITIFMFRKIIMSIVVVMIVFCHGAAVLGVNILENLFVVVCLRLFVKHHCTTHCWVIATTGKGFLIDARMYSSSSVHPPPCSILEALSLFFLFLISLLIPLMLFFSNRFVSTHTCNIFVCMYIILQQ